MLKKWNLSKNRGEGFEKSYVPLHRGREVKNCQNHEWPLTSSTPINQSHIVSYTKGYPTKQHIQVITPLAYKPECRSVDGNILELTFIYYQLSVLVSLESSTRDGLNRKRQIIVNMGEINTVIPVNANGARHQINATEPRLANGKSLL